MPNILQICGYYVFIWMNEKNEPVHVHANKKRPCKNSTKFWLTSAGGCLIANNASRIPEKDLKIIQRAIVDNYYLICNKWKDTFGQKELKFYC